MEEFIMAPTLLQGWLVLVVDDEPDSLLIPHRLLKKCGAEVLTASNGKLGLDLATQRRPRFIISDLSMPEMSGWEMLYHLKNTPSTVAIPVIALTAHAMSGDRERAMEAGFHNYLTKPLRPETFISDLLNLLVDIPTIGMQLRPMIGL
jgi:CheY-like chemotaxis protein